VKLGILLVAQVEALLPSSGTFFSKTNSSIGDFFLWGKQ